MIKNYILYHITKNRKRLENGGNVLDTKIRGYLPKGCSLNPHVARLITNKDVGGEYSYDKEKEVWFVKFPNTSLGLSTAARLYCGIIKKGYVIPPNDALRNAIFEHFEVNHFAYLPNEIWDSAII